MIPEHRPEYLSLSITTCGPQRKSNYNRGGKNLDFICDEVALTPSGVGLLLLGGEAPVQHLMSPRPLSMTLSYPGQESQSSGPEVSVLGSFRAVLSHTGGARRTGHQKQGWTLLSASALCALSDPASQERKCQTSEAGEHPRLK